MTKIQFTSEETQYIINEYKKGTSRRQLKLKFGISDSVIKRILEENNIQIRGVKEVNSKRKYNVDDFYFDRESPNMAYILGFWAADGNVHRTENRLDLELSSLDREILDKIREEIRSERPIKVYECRSGYVKNKLYFWSSHIKKVFISYGIVPNKTYSKDFKFPYKLNRKYWIDYIRGFFDGDGTIYKVSSITFSISSANRKILEEMQRFFLEDYNIELTISTNGMKGRNIPLYDLYGYGHKARDIYKIFYTPNSLYLKRKKDKWEELMK